MKIALILMIKNESKILRRCLEAVENVVDCFCILDTGSTDNTVEIANEFLKTRIGCVTVEPWKNFGHNRTASFQNAQKYIGEELKWDLKETYGLLLDADMMFVPGKLRQQNLDKTGYRMIQVNGTLEYYNTRLVRMDYPWKCIGVTHEYWDGPTEMLPKEISFIDDRNDGGCKHDKYERDQRLLEKGLEEDPTNVRYMFYLAQTYKCMGKFKDSIQMYKKRIAAGGWPEEVWYSHYMIGDCWKNLGNIIKFEEWMQKAHAYRQCRTESIYKLAEHYRVVGQHYKAYHYTKIGLSTPYPQNDVLFIEGDVYRGKFDYEASILDYYVHSDKKIGLRDSLTYMLKSSNNYNNVISNIKFYTTPISTRYTKLNIPDVFGKEFHPSAISIVEYPFANARFVNYKIEPNGSYTTPNGIVQTKNAYVNLETGECISAFNEPTYVFDSHIRGLEDMRLYKYNDKLYFTSTSYKQFIQDKISIVTGEYDHETGTYKNYRGVKSPLDAGCEKNWVNIAGTDEFVYSWSPLRTGKIVNDKFLFNREHSTPPFFSHLRGSSQVVKYNNNWLALVHFVEYCVPRKYYHCFVEMNEMFQPIRISLPFYFKNNAIEFCISIRILETEIECYPSFNDANPEKVTILIKDLSWVTVSESQPKNNIVRVPENTQSYWNGREFCACFANGDIEKYVNYVINKDKLNVSAVFSFSDGFFNEKYSDITLDRLKERYIDVLNKSAVKNTIPMICASSTFGINRENVLLLPYSDKTFSLGLKSHLEKNTMIPWNQRKPIVFWRGGPSGYEINNNLRRLTCKKLLGNIHADVKFFRSVDTVNISEEYLDQWCDIDKQYQYKFLLAIDGNTIPSNHQAVFGMGCVPILIQRPDANFWFKKYLKHKENCIIANIDELPELIDWLLQNDSEAERIAKNALQLSYDIFNPEFQKEYIRSEIHRISKLTNI